MCHVPVHTTPDRRSADECSGGIEELLQKRGTAFFSEGPSDMDQGVQNSFMASPPRHGVWRTVFRQLWWASFTTRRSNVEVTTGNPTIAAALKRASDPYIMLPVARFNGQPKSTTGKYDSCAPQAVHQNGASWFNNPRFQAERRWALQEAVIGVVLLILMVVCLLVLLALAARRYGYCSCPLLTASGVADAAEDAVPLSSELSGA